MTHQIPTPTIDLVQLAQRYGVELRKEPASAAPAKPLARVYCKDFGGGMSEQDKLLFALGVLRHIAMSYGQRFDRDDTPPYVLADEALYFLGDDVELIHPEYERMGELMRAFRKWRAETGTP